MPRPQKELLALAKSLAAGQKAQAHFSLNHDNKDQETRYERLFLPPERLILLGGGHISRHLAKLAAYLDFEVTVVDDRPFFAHPSRFPQAKETICAPFVQAVNDLAIKGEDYVCLLTRGHRYDQVALEEIFKGKVRPHYLGMIGSRRRVRDLLNLLVDQGYDPADTGRVQAPIGLDIGATSPKEISVSILAQLISYRHKKIKETPGTVLLEKTETDPQLTAYLKEAPAPYALAVVLRTKGSTPADSGSLMAVDPLGRIYGTIGGGCGEDRVRRQAQRALKSGQDQVLTIDMTNDVAEDQGMVCGGTMTVLIQAVTA